MALIKCPECGKKVSDSATSCPNCGHPLMTKRQNVERVVEKRTVIKQKKKGHGCLTTILFAVLIIAVIGMAASSGDKKGDSSAAESKEPITYTAYSVNDMMNDLSSNAMAASDKYKDQYLEITGRLDVIDSSGKYISLYPDDEFAIIGVTCNLTNDDQKSAVAKMQKGQTVTVKGKCTAVGEVIGYSLDIDEIVQ